MPTSISKTSPTADNIPDTALTIVVASCDKYQDVLSIFVDLWKHHWPDCPFECVLVTESHPTDKIAAFFSKTIDCGPNLSWGKRLNKALETITSPLILLLCDDYLLEADVSTEKIRDYIRLAIAHNAANLRLIPNPIPHEGIDPANSLSKYRPYTAYCVATQAGIWKREYLLALSNQFSSIWEFERKGSFAFGETYGLLLATDTKQFPFIDAIHKGKWEPFGLDCCRKHGIEVDLHIRGTASRIRKLIEWIKGRILALNPTVVVKLQNRFGIGKQ